MSDDKVLAMCLSVVAVVCAVCFSNCERAKNASEDELKLLCLKSRGTFEFGLCKLPAECR